MSKLKPELVSASEPAGSGPEVESARESESVAPSPETPNPFNVESLRLPPAFAETAGVKRMWNVIRVRKPHRQEWIRVHGNAYFPKDFHINREVRPSEKDAVANVSNRGVAGVGERTLITGLIITGGEPRNVVVRAIGPSLAQHGVRQFAANPKLEVYRGSSRIAMNDNWQDDPRANSLGALAPGNNHEAAMLLTLLPGSYTLHGINEEGTEGMILLEAYDVDSGSE